MAHATTKMSRTSATAPIACHMNENTWIARKIANSTATTRRIRRSPSVSRIRETILGPAYHARVPQRTSLIERYSAHLPVTARTPRITLGEGDTPLLRARSFERELGIDEVWLKVEGANPTGSFKDRGMVVAVAKALEEGSRAVLCASTGNTAASAAAYAAHAGLPCTVVLPAGHVAQGKLAQAMVFGARIVQVRGAFDAALAVVRELR